MAIKNKFADFGETHYSKDKKFLNAVITSDGNYNPRSKKIKIAFKNMLYIYALIIFVVTSASLAMLSLSNNYVKSHKTFVTIVESIVFIVLSIDVALRWYTSEVKIKKGNWSYFIFPISFVGAILIFSLLPSLYLINVWTGKDWKVFNTFENMKFLRIFRIVLLANIVPGVQIFKKVLQKEKSVLYAVFSIVLIAIVLFALVIYNIEQGVDSNGIKPGHSGYLKKQVQFSSFGDALYFSTITLTTIGFGDKTPHTNMGRIVTMIMSIIGIAVLATPSGVIAGGFISEIKERKKIKESKNPKRKNIKK